MIHTPPARIAAVLALAGCCACGWAARADAVPAPAMAGPYLDLTVTYCVYAKSLWHDADVGGYWGDGLAPRPDQNGNGNVRGMCNTMLGYAMLVHAGDNGWLNADEQKRLTNAGLDRAGLLRYVRANLDFLSAHHVSAGGQSREPQWGHSWQSALWLGAAGPAAMLVWSDLLPAQRDGIFRIAASEADWKSQTPPKDYRPGDTGAEENAWDQQSPAVALALMPSHAHAGQWWKTLRLYTMNVYSTKADRASDSNVGRDRVRDLVSTANLFDDYTLENHGFFHPDYVQVSGQHMGEAWAILKLGDRLHGTDRATEFEPYALHHLRHVWESVLRPIVLPDGNLAFPAGNDWTFNCSMNPSYYAFVGEALGDPVAYAAERAHIGHALRRRAASPAGRIFGDTNMEWWWEPLLVKRMCTALLQHELRGGRVEKLAPAPALDDESRVFTALQFWTFRNRSYFASASWGTQKMGTLVPFDAAETDRPYLALPFNDGILPAEVGSLAARARVGDAEVIALLTRDGKRVVVVALPNSIVWISPLSPRPMGIENDRLSGGARRLVGARGIERIPALTARPPLTIAGNWLNIDGRFGMVCSGEGFRYTPAGGFNRRSVAIDTVVPVQTSGAWQMVPGADAGATQRCADAFSVRAAPAAWTVTLLDGPIGKRYTIRADVDGPDTAPASRATNVRATGVPGFSIEVAP